MTNYKMIIAYDGKRYKGFRKTKTDAEKTIQGKLEAILKKKYETDIEVIGAVNTDAGVSAAYQVVNFKIEDEMPNPSEVFDYFETYLPDDIITLDVTVEDDRFQSRYATEAITYAYRLWKKDAPNRPLFDRQRVNRMDRVLDCDLMQTAADLMLGEHDFRAFSTKSKVKSSVKELYDLDIYETDEEIVITLKANGYLLNMERIIVGTLIQVGLGDKEPETVKKAFSSLNSKYTGHKAMAPALTLIEVELREVEL